MCVASRSSGLLPQQGGGGRGPSIAPAAAQFALIARSCRRSRETHWTRTQQNDDALLTHRASPLRPGSRVAKKQSRKLEFAASCTALY